ncbi:hypothetical protein [Maioricimonas sp. JC845]|uniref:hypothetical protein n=1 Tax=Maioricimonas sp. JC845 TaxID=3232138 RepID=UPI0034592716
MPLHPRGGLDNLQATDRLLMTWPANVVWQTKTTGWRTSTASAGCAEFSQET